LPNALTYDEHVNTKNERQCNGEQIGNITYIRSESHVANVQVLQQIGAHGLHVADETSIRVHHNHLQPQRA